MARKTKMREDTSETAFRVLQEAVGERPKTLPPDQRTEKNPEAVRRGRKGGKKGGKARSKALSSKEKTASARKAAEDRWINRPTSSTDNVTE